MAGNNPRSPRVGDPQEQLAHRVGQEQAVAEMDQPVEMVALQAQEVVELHAKQRLAPGVLGHSA